MDGVIPLNKKIGQTSSDYVYKLRKVLHTRKIGHTGTLDPLVDGVLPICVGQATKLVNTLTGSPKEYEGEITLGKSTTTEDREGDTVEEKKLAEPIASEDLQKVFQQMTGELTQIPPMFSAVKVNGKKLYEYARAGLEVERPKRQIHIYDFYIMGNPVYDEITGYQTLKFHVKCSKGTYVRTLAVEFGRILGYPAFMSQLTRVKSAGFSIDETFTLGQIEEMLEKNDMSFLKSIDEVLSDVPKHELTDEEWEVRVSHGGFLEPEIDSDIEDRLRVQRAGVTKALYKYDKVRNMWIPDLMLLNNK
ncbi:tRNA pseudouridine(55) synthase TruB [Companilactobacillus kimchii]|uniref:tRNA pseudouridine synthase B n=2 Tax=Companilactobacillus kimchii TaxID=2801452 RepID=A0ABR5NQ84_9LACO|nr:tRNA pseudouridine(55) synthase TruB [Companilactobacillus kimchii]KAE9562784.1 pseudouridine synthase [Companilactobacillus kimchii]KRK49814.1 tRNA pseudouridine synthase B [Companilactobacillus kimchii DSM 13961 = JCM 10707]OWF33219.1 tRNA pseudouridine(55) synthase [Companilactobacillus kimchii]GEO46696.1 tRNA pseudouridine synthase B [Companilactobacillus paralimentarius]